MKYSIQLISKKNFKMIAKIWKESLTDNIYSILGNKFIFKYLNFFFYSNNCGFIIKIKKKIVGFILFGDDNYLNKLIIKKYFLKVSFRLIILLFSKKNFFWYILKLFIFIIFYNLKYRSLYERNKIELLIICVKKKNQNNGIGSELLHYSISYLKKNFITKYNKIIVKTVLTNIKNIRFYKKNSFKYYKTIYPMIFFKKSL